MNILRLCKKNHNFFKISFKTFFYDIFDHFFSKLKNITSLIGHSEAFLPIELLDELLWNFLRLLEVDILSKLLAIIQDFNDNWQIPQIVFHHGHLDRASQNKVNIWARLALIVNWLTFLVYFDIAASHHSFSNFLRISLKIGKSG